MKITKKITAVLLVFVLTLVIIPLSAFTVAAETISMGYIFETNVNIRADATTNAAKIAQVSNLNVSVLDNKKDTASVINPNTNKVYVWYKITYNSSSGTVTGYVREDLIRVTTYTISESFEETLEAFPKSYHESLKQLHAMYPNWKFIADSVPSTFSNAVAAQDKEYMKLVETDYNSWRSMRNKCFNWSTGKFITTDGGRYGASTEVIAYYMDPRNFLNANDIYIYMQQSYDKNTQTVKGVQTILKNTFLSGKITNKNDANYDKTYAKAIVNAASKSGVSPYVLASTIIQEHGTKGTTLSKGYTYNGKTVYNFFNYGASGTTSADILKNGAKYAYDNEWFTPTAAIVGGAKKYASGYISVGQDTYFYKNYNVLNPDELWHQYAQNVADSLNSSRNLKKTYSEQYNTTLTFRIPVYTSIPSTVSKLPAKSNKLNNYYFNSLSVDGLSPNFNRYTTKYTLSVTGDTTINYKLPNGVTYTGQSVYPLVKGKNTVKLKVKSQTGYTRTYTITVTATKDANLSVLSEGASIVKESDNKWYYYVNGKKSDATTLASISGKWYYIKNGIWSNTTTALVKMSDKSYYIRNGMWRNTTTAPVKLSGKWYYIKKGIWQSTTTAIVKANEKWFYIKNGMWKNTTTSLIKVSGTWYYVKEGRWNPSTKTLIKYSGKWFYIEGGKWVQKTLIFTYSGKKFYIKSGKAALDFSGTVYINGKYYKIKGGKVV